jgi:hypothetical protein
MQAIELKREFFLSELPVEETVEVRVVFGGITYTFVRDTFETPPSRLRRLLYLQPRAK